MKAAAAVLGGKKVVSFCEVFFVLLVVWEGCLFVFVVGELGSCATRTHASMKTYPISWVG
jgi:hypothetical protein